MAPQQSSGGAARLPPVHTGKARFASQGRVRSNRTSIQRPTGREVVFIPESLAFMQPEPGKPDLTGIFTESNSAILRNSVVPSMNMEEVEVFTVPGEGQQKKFMELGEAGLAADQQAPPNQRAHIPKHHSKLIKLCHLSSLPDIPGKSHRQTPGFFRSPGAELLRGSDAQRRCIRACRGL